MRRYASLCFRGGFSTSSSVVTAPKIRNNIIITSNIFTSHAHFFIFFRFEPTADTSQSLKVLIHISNTSSKRFNSRETSFEFERRDRDLCTRSKSPDVRGLLHYPTCRIQLVGSQLVGRGPKLGRRAHTNTQPAVFASRLAITRARLPKLGPTSWAV